MKGIYLETQIFTFPKNSTPPIVFSVFFCVCSISVFLHVFLEHRSLGLVRWVSPELSTTKAAKNELFDLKSRAQRKYRAPKAHRDRAYEATNVRQREEMRAEWMGVGWLVWTTCC